MPNIYFIKQLGHVLRIDAASYQRSFQALAVQNDGA
jgi:hypothetical protein